MQWLFNFIKENSELLILYSAIANIFLIMMLILQANKISKLDKKYKNLARGMEDKNLEEIIYRYYEKIDQTDIRINKIDQRLAIVEGKLLKSIQKVGMVRYNAFHDIGGDLSFSIALLDEEHNGFILTSIYGRSNNVVYGKPIKKGKSSYTLSAEELQALDRAKNNSLDEYAKAIS
ncbi:DUF4446 family protein [Thermotalea metallivorans]|uniref:DUF4446 domain-containing protein n=1 Tax=Thermotalea metallivorans TaxID=520762 RepID=A0A140KZY0_9FIRM|nr:DUF4446 family protein [Thermotalea metallivorans]KXG73855.1 hypothetical protein AN619_27750 [Thermotalea metallivorans]